jgi:hypothetical protein
MSGRVFIKSAYTDHIPLQVTHVFNESGADPDTFSPIGATIMSSFASVADPATRKEPAGSFPGKNCTLTFDTNFMRGLVGFLPQTTWHATQTSDFIRNTTEYSFGINVGFNNGVTGGIVSGGNVTNNTITKNNFSNTPTHPEKGNKTAKGYYFQGNPTKNKFINRNLMNLENSKILEEILRYMIIKEMGDMMQVYVMLVWFYLQVPQITKDKFVMSTTDLVVMNTCQLFQMPCLYTNQGKDTSLLTEQEKTDFEYMLQNKIDNKGTLIYNYNNWKKNNKFANTLYYLPFEESLELKKKRRLNTIYYIIKTQNEKQLGIFQKEVDKVENLRYIKMGRLGPLMTSFSNTIIRDIILRIIENIQNINHNLLVEYNRLIKLINLNEYNEDERDIELKKQFSLHILITRQKYPPTVGNTYVYVIQNLTHYTEELLIGNGTSKLVDMILDNNIVNFKTVDRETEEVGEPELNIPKNPKVSGPGPNENWLIYSIANWFNGVRDQLNTMFGNVFQKIDFFGDLSDNYWMGVGGAGHKYNDEINGPNNLGQPYMNIGFVTMMPCIYEQLCSIYEKHDIVYDDDFGKTFIINFILNLTRYYQDQDNGNIPTLTSPYDKIDNSGDPGTNAKPYPYSYNLIPKIPSSPEDGIHHDKPYDKYVIHTNDVNFEIKNIQDSELEFKQELEKEMTDITTLRIVGNDTNNNVFTVDDIFARELINKSGLTFNEPPEQLITPLQGTTPEQVIVNTPIRSLEDLETFLSPDRPENKEKLFELIITPLKEKNIIGLEYLNNINLDTIDNILSNGFPEILINKLNKIIEGNINIPNDEENELKNLIEVFIKTGRIQKRETGETLDFGETPPSTSSYEETEIHDGPSGGKIIKNKKTRRRNKRSHKKHHNTNKRHKKYQKSGKNKTRKTKKTKRKNKTV